MGVEVLELELTVIKADGLAAKDTDMWGRRTSSDPYVEVRLCPAGPIDSYGKKYLVGTTTTKTKTLCPSWEETFVTSFPKKQFCEFAIFELTIMDYDRKNEDDLMGIVPVHIPIAKSGTTTKWYGVPKSSAEGDEATGRIQVTLKTNRRMLEPGEVPLALQKKAVEPEQKENKSSFFSFKSTKSKTDATASDNTTTIETLELDLTVLRAKGLASRDNNFLGMKAKSDPYIEVRFCPQGQSQEDDTKILLGKTPHKMKTWRNQTFSFTLPKKDLSQLAMFELAIMDYDESNEDDLMGRVTVPITGKPESINTKWYQVPANSADGEEASGKVECVLGITAGVQEVQAAAAVESDQSEEAAPAPPKRSYGSAAAKPSYRDIPKESTATVPMSVPEPTIKEEKAPAPEPSALEAAPEAVANEKPTQEIPKESASELSRNNTPQEGPPAPTNVVPIVADNQEIEIESDAPMDVKSRRISRINRRGSVQGNPSLMQRRGSNRNLGLRRANTMDAAIRLGRNSSDGTEDESLETRSSHTARRPRRTSSIDESLETRSAHTARRDRRRSGVGLETSAKKLGTSTPNLLQRRRSTRKLSIGEEQGLKRVDRAGLRRTNTADAATRCRRNSNEDEDLKTTSAHQLGVRRASTVGAATRHSRRSNDGTEATQEKSLNSSSADQLGGSSHTARRRRSTAGLETSAKKLRGAKSTPNLQRQRSKGKEEEGLRRVDRRLNGRKSLAVPKSKSLTKEAATRIKSTRESMLVKSGGVGKSQSLFDDREKGASALKRRSSSSPKRRSSDEEPPKKGSIKGSSNLIDEKGEGIHKKAPPKLKKSPKPSPSGHGTTEEAKKSSSSSRSLNENDGKKNTKRRSSNKKLLPKPESDSEIEIEEEEDKVSIDSPTSVQEPLDFEDPQQQRQKVCNIYSNWANLKKAQTSLDQRKAKLMFS